MLFIYGISFNDSFSFLFIIFNYGIYNKLSKNNRIVTFDWYIMLMKQLVITQIDIEISL